MKRLQVKIRDFIAQETELAQDIKTLTQKEENLLQVLQES